jgi:hypothetical protein
MDRAISFGRVSVLAGLIAAASSNVAVAEDAPRPMTPSALPDITNDLEEKVRAIDEKYTNTLKTQRDAIENLTAEIKALGGTTADRAKADKLIEDKVDALTKLAAARSEKRAQLVTERYQKGDDLLGDMMGSAATVMFVAQLLSVEAMLSRSTNLWRDEDFRNGWDVLSDWGMIIGGVVGIVGGVAFAAGKDSDATSAGAATLATGAGVATLSKLGGSVFGKQNGDALKEKAQFIEFTRRAYDDLSSRIDTVKAVRESAAQFTSELGSFRTKYGDPNKFAPKGAVSLSSDELKQMAINELQVKVQRYAAIVAQVSTLLNAYDVLVKKYEKSPVEAVRTDMASLRATLNDARSNYEQNVLPFLLLEGRVAVLFGPTVGE